MKRIFITSKIALRVFLTGLFLFFWCGCCAGKRELHATGLARVFPSVPTVRDVNALNHFMRAQQSALEGDLKTAVKELEEAVKWDPDSAYLRKVLAYLYYQEGDQEKALKAIERAIKMDPSRADAYFVKGLILMKLKRLEEAGAAFMEASRLDPENPEYITNAAYAFLQAGESEEAVKQLKDYLQEHPREPETLYLLGHIYHQLGRLEEAEKFYLQALSIQPAHYPALTSLLRAQYQLGKLDDAIATGLKTLNFYPGDHLVRLTVVEMLIKKQDLKSALALLSQGKTFTPPVAEYWVRSGFILLSLNRLKEGEQELRTALSLDPANEEAVLGLGLSASAQGRIVEAESYFQSLPPSSPYYAVARRELALIAIRQKKPESALKILNQLEETHPGDKETIILHYTVLRDLERYQEAEKVLKKGLERFPNDDTLLYELGMLYYLTGREQASLALMRDLLVRNPDNAQALNFIGYTYAEQGIRLDEAEQMIRKALELEPGSGYIMDSLGWVYYQRGQYQKAMEWIDKALKASGPDPEILEHKADIYRATGQIDKAREFYKKALQKAKTSRIKKRIKEKLEQAG